ATTAWCGMQFSIGRQSWRQSHAQPGRTLLAKLPISGTQFPKLFIPLNATMYLCIQGFRSGKVSCAVITVGRTFFSASRKTCPDDSICGRVPALNNVSLKPQYTPQPAIVYRGNPRKFGRARKWFLRFGIATVVILVVATCFLWAYWPF